MYLTYLMGQVTSVGSLCQKFIQYNTCEQHTRFDFMFQIHHVGSMSTFSESSQIRKSSQWMSFQLCFCHLHINRVDHRLTNKE